MVLAETWFICWTAQVRRGWFERCLFKPSALAFSEVNLNYLGPLGAESESSRQCCIIHDANRLS
jgi:hypothetical protein